MNEERRKYAQLEDDFANLKMEIDRKKNEFVSILNDKDSMILELKKDIVDFTKNNMNSMMIP